MFLYSFLNFKSAEFDMRWIKFSPVSYGTSPQVAFNLMHNHVNANKDSEIISIRTTLRQLDDAARDITDKRVVLLRRLDVLEAKTSVLPPETLSLIFKYACVPREIPTKYGLPLGKDYSRERKFLPVFLGSISHTWRQVAWSTPELWTELSLTIPSGKATKFAPLLDLFLSNVRGLPITLHMTIGSQYPAKFEEDPLARVFFKEGNLGKIGVLTLSGAPTTWLEHFDGAFSQLTDFCLDGGSGLPVSFPFLANAPNLRKLSLTEFHGSLKIPGPLLTTLTLENVSIAVVLQCLLDAPNLVQFHYVILTDPRFLDDDDFEEGPLGTVPDVLTLPFLETLSWSFKLYHASDFLIRRIHFPALRSLTWHQREMSLTGAFSAGIWDFFENLSSAPLTTLRLTGLAEIDITSIKRIYRHNSGVETLCFNECSAEALCVALASLIPGWNGEGSADERYYLTKLKMLEVGSCRGQDYIGERLGDIVADLLIARTSADFCPTLCVNLVFGMKRMEWATETMEFLQEFSDGGAGVQLLEDGKQVDWL